MSSIWVQGHHSQSTLHLLTLNHSSFSARLKIADGIDDEKANCLKKKQKKAQALGPGIEVTAAIPWHNQGCSPPLHPEDSKAAIPPNPLAEAPAHSRMGPTALTSKLKKKLPLWCANCQKHSVVPAWTTMAKS